MATNSAQVSSAALRGLQSNLKNLSKAIQEICDNLNSDRSRIGQEWRDQKFEEFSNGFQPQIVKCQGISERYETWASGILNQAAEQVEIIEQANVGSSGGSVGAAVSNAAVGGAAVAASSASQIGSKFNTGAGGAAVTNTSKQTTHATSSSKNRTGNTKEQSKNDKPNWWGRKLDMLVKKEEPLSKADQACKDAYGKNWHDYQGIPDENVKYRQVSFNNGETKTSGKWEVGANAEAGVSGPFYGLKGSAKVGVQAKYSTGDKTTNNSIDGVAFCVPDIDPE